MASFAGLSKREKIMQKLINAFIIGICSLFLFVPASYSADNGNGVDVTTKNWTKAFVQHAEWFTDYDPDGTSTYIYNESAGTSTTSGEFNTEFVFDKANISIYIDTFGTAGTLTVRIEGKTRDGAWQEILTQPYTAAQTIAESFPIVTYFDSIRVGILVTDVAVDNVTIEGDFLTIKRNSQ